MEYMKKLLNRKCTDDFLYRCFNFIKIFCMENSEAPFSNIQMELLQLYKSNVSDADLFVIKKMIADYFAKKAIGMADEIWDREGWDDKKIEELLQTKMRTQYKKRIMLK